MKEKYAHETRLETYICDCLWLPATGKIIKELDRYSDFNKKRPSKSSTDIRTGDQILSDTIATFERGSD